MKIRNPSDFGAGLLITGISLAFLVTGQSLPQGTLSEMGPGWFPRHVALLALLAGIALVVRSLARSGHPLPRFRIRPLLAFAAAVFAFAVCINRFGFVIAAPLTLLIASLAVTDTRMRVRLLIALMVSLIAAAIFIGALGLSIPLWPGQ